MLLPAGSRLVFDQILGTAVSKSVTPPHLDDWLGLGNDVKFFLVADRISNAGSINVVVGETANQQKQTWISPPGGDGPEPVISGQLDPSTNLVLTGADTELTRGHPGLAFRRLQVDVNVPSVHVRIWAAPRSGYRVFHRLVFDDRVEGAEPVYTAQQACSWLANADKLVVVTSVPEYSATVQLEESPDGVSWQGVGSPSVADSDNDGVLSFSDGLPTSGFIRFRVEVSPFGPTDVRIWATGRETRRSA